MDSLKKYIKNLVGFGRYFFTKQDAISQLGIEESQFKYQAYRLSRKKSIKKIIKDFFMIISDEYQAMGSLPPNWIIDPLMKYLEQDYYVSLLTAASMYGSTEQQPMVFQVITTKAIKNINIQRVSIQFYVDKYCSSAFKDKIITPTGYMQVSTKEQTIVDLVRHYKVSGYLSNVALVISSLSNEVNSKKFQSILKHEKNNPSLQRLGYILESTNHNDLANLVEMELSHRLVQYVNLRSDITSKLGDKDKKWKLILNDNMEI